MKTILFIGHDANRAGAQLVLLQLMRLLKPHGFVLKLLLGEGGPLLPDYQQLATVTIWPTSQPHVVGRLADKLLGKLGMWQAMANWQVARQQAAMQQQLNLDSVDMVLVNTVTSGRWFRQLVLPDTLPVIAFVHELAMSVKMYTQPDDLRYLLQRANRILAVSEATAYYYQIEHHVPAEKLSLFTLIDLPVLQQRLAEARQQADTEPTELPGLEGLPEGAILIGGCGNAEWRKGNDLFTTLAQITGSRFTELPIYFVWVGMGPGPYRDELELDRQKAGLEDRLRFIEPTPAVLHYIARFAAFVLCSREDPYPLVVLEAGLSAVPVVCFDKAGGAPELIETDGGFVVPYLDIVTMSDRIGLLASQPVLRQQLGNRLAQKIAERHSSEQSLSQLLTIIDHLIKE